MDGATTIAQEIRAQREAVGLSREGLAAAAGVSVKTVERIEWGKVSPRRATLAMIQQALEAEAAAA